MTIILSFLIILTAFRKNDSNKSSNTNRIDLESKLTQPPAVVVESGCTAIYFSTVEIKNPVANTSTAKFTIVFYNEQKALPFSVEEVNDQPTANHSSFQPFTLEAGQILSVKLKFQLKNKDFDFNKSYVIKGNIIPKRNGANFSFIDDNKTNDLLTQEILIGSPNVICYKCLETENISHSSLLSFFIPGVDYSTDCQKFPAIISNSPTTTELKKPVSRQENEKLYFEFIENGVIANTTIKKVLIKNTEGKYLTYSNNFPRFMDRISNDLHSYQDWVILKTLSNNCRDKKYKLVQYLDGNNCKELIQSEINNKFYLKYRNGISADNSSEKILIDPKYEVNSKPNKD